MPYSKITSKGQMTVPVTVRRKYHLKPGTRVSFEEKNGDLLLKPLPDIAETGGSLAEYADVEEVLRDLLEERKRPFR